MKKNELTLSDLPKVWFIDIDGTIVKHNGFKIDGADTILVKSKSFMDCISPSDRVILVTARSQAFAQETEHFLLVNGIRYD